MLTPQQVAEAAAERFSSGSDAAAYFESRFRADFIDWFNANCANRGAWQGKALVSSAGVKSRFLAFWNNIPVVFDSPSISLIQFAALVAILITEAGPELLPSPELCGREGYPGLVYPFEEIPGVKVSYNSASGNRPAGELFFGDSHFWSAHGHLPPAELVRAIPNLRDEWNTRIYPQHLFPSTLDPAETGFIQQADFYKFRGRGFIQTTWRANYRPLVEFVQNYHGANATLARYRSIWAGMDADVVCTTSTNEDWDTLFEEPELLVACHAMALHNRASGDYLRLSEDAVVLASRSNVPGSLYHMGLRINGGAAYAATFSKRTTEMISAIFPA